MANVVFVLGAGASAGSGGPLMNNFFERADYLRLTDRIEPKYRDAFTRVFRARDALQIVHSKSQLDLDNIEAIFGMFEMGRTLGKFPGFPDGEIESVLDAMRTLITITLEETITFTHEHDL